jgi:hypothetical protein
MYVRQDKLFIEAKMNNFGIHKFISKNSKMPKGQSEVVNKFTVDVLK